MHVDAAVTAAVAFYVSVGARCDVRLAHGRQHERERETISQLAINRPKAPNVHERARASVMCVMFVCGGLVG